MDIVDARHIGDARWDELCAVANGSWFWHTSSWRDYTRAYRPALASRSLAFAVVDDDQPLALIPLMAEADPDSGATRLSFGGDAVWSPAVAVPMDDERAAVALKVAFEHVDVIAQAEGAESVRMRVSPLAAGGGAYLAAFLAATTRSGYADASLCSQVIDLELPLDVIRRQMRKGHRADITRGRRAITTAVLSGHGADAEFEAYRRMHALAAGRVTRPAATFDLMRGWLQRGSAALVTAATDGEAVGFTYLLLHGDGAYYASAANHPDAAALPVGHVLHASAIEWLQRRGIRRYELGLQQFGPLPYDVPSTKEMGIAAFKRGFGGRTVPSAVREKWYSRDAYELVSTRRHHEYLSARWPSTEDLV